MVRYRAGDAETLGRTPHDEHVGRVADGGGKAEQCAHHRAGIGTTPRLEHDDETAERELKAKGKDARFKKTERGKFAFNG